jgi:hypothetical protein
MIRKIKELRLSKIYQDTKTKTNNWLNQTFEIPFLSTNKIRDFFIKNCITSIPSNLKFHEHVDYLVEIYTSEESKFPTGNMDY